MMVEGEPRMWGEEEEEEEVWGCCMTSPPEHRS